MLLPDNIHPAHCIYYNGAVVLNELRKRGQQTIMNLYESMKNDMDMSFSTFILCLDWLYLIEAARINERGIVELCS